MSTEDAGWQTPYADDPVAMNMEQALAPYASHPSLQLALEKLPDIQDGVTDREADALNRLYSRIKPLQIPDRSPGVTGHQVLRIRLEMTGRANESFSGIIWHNVETAVPAGFEDSDRIVDNHTQYLEWSAGANWEGDVDAITITFQSPFLEDGIEIEDHNWKRHRVTVEAILAGPVILGSEQGVDGTLTISDAGSDPNLAYSDNEQAREGRILADMISAGKGGLSPPLEALFWRYQDGEQDPFAKYTGALAFTERTWQADRNYERWDDFNGKVLPRLKDLEYATAFFQAHIRQVDTLYPQDPDTTVRRRKGSCKSFADIYQQAALQQGIPEHRTNWVTFRPRDSDGHTFLYVVKSEAGDGSPEQGFTYGSARTPGQGPFTSWQAAVRSYGEDPADAIVETRGEFYARFR